MPLAEAKYSMGHDIYSLGVFMLEVLLWRRLLIQSATRETKPSILSQDMVKRSAVKFDSTDDIDM